MTKQGAKVAAAKTVVVADNNASEAIAKVKSILRIATPEKAMRIFNRTKNDNIKLDKFLSQVFSIPKSFQAEHVNAQIEALINPKNHEHHGVVKVEEQKQILDALCEEFVGAEIAAKTEWISQFKLDNEQEVKAAQAMTAYSNMLKGAIKNVAAWRKVYGE